MDGFEIDLAHVKEQFLCRYKNFGDRADGIIERVMNVLRRNAPDDWRFTESPSSRFFVVDEETEAKFLGLTFRDSPACRQIVCEIRQNLLDTPKITKDLASHAERYIADVQNPQLPIVHHIRTVYGKSREAHIAEEKRLFEQAKSVVSHTVPLISHKIASRPNAVVCSDGSLLVRQYLNWVSMELNSREFYLFQPLTKNGIDRGKAIVFSYSDNGRLKRVAERSFDCSACIEPMREIKEIVAREEGVRSESYWKVPTFLDCRLVDLDFMERYSEKGADLSSSDLLELYYLRRIVERARAKFCRK